MTETDEERANARKEYFFESRDIRSETKRK
jgi:hypothetical protein